jgi:DNA-3-methyladenine glycosylase
VASGYGKTFGDYSHPIGCNESMNETIPDSGNIRVRRLRRAELPANTVKLGRYLIGKTLVRDLPEGRLSGRIVETEAYPVGDKAGHAYTGRSLANNSLFLARGTAYVRFTYGTHWLFNVASETPGVGAGVLIRALEPIEGISLMKQNRGVSNARDLARGPGRLAAALRIDKSLDGVDLCAADSTLWLGTPVRRLTGVVGVSVRIGITRDAHRRLRFYERGNRFISGSVRLST